MFTKDVSTPALPRVRASELVGRGWLNTGGRSVSLADLRGKVVILDFWTFCCVNCLHVLDELRDLEARFPDVLVIVGVHSPKFVHEADPDALAAAVERYEVHHPVLDDPTLVTWQAYTARAWPTLVVVDPEGYVVAHLAGEGHGPALAALVEKLVDVHEARGTLRRGDGPYVPPEPTPGTLRFPAKAVALPSGHLLVADAGHHSLAELAADGETLVRRIGSGSRGRVDGTPDEARFAEPNGLCLVPDELRGRLGYDVLVADTANHLLRGVRLADGQVSTVAGTGEQYVVGGPDNVIPWPDDDRAAEMGAGRPDNAVPLTDDHHASDLAAVTGAGRPDNAVPLTDDHHGGALAADAGPGPYVSTLHLDASAPPAEPAELAPAFLSEPRRHRLSSPWDVVWSQELAAFVIAMAGNHTLWAFDGEEDSLRHLAGTMNEGLQDGPADEAWFAQPSGLAVGPDGRIWVADSETSALRWLDPHTLTVHTAVGAGLFDFGHRDGPADEARLQHPLGVAVADDGSILVADTYNGAVRRYAHQRGTSVTPGATDGPPTSSLGGSARRRDAAGAGRVGSSAPIADGSTQDDPAASAPRPERVDFSVPTEDNSTRSDPVAGAVRAERVDFTPPDDRKAAHGDVGEVTTVAEGLAEPSGLVVTADGVLVVESAAHRITRLASSGPAAVDRGAHRTQRPVTNLAPGDLELVVPFTPAPGQKSDDRYGPSTWLSVSSSPPELLLDGAGDDVPLGRRLRLNPDVTEGVLHVSARAASCDADPAVEFPACHLAQQDWGVPVRIVPGAPTTLMLPLLGS